MNAEPPQQQCTMGFLNNQSLRLITEADPGQTSPCFSRSQLPTSLALDQTGPLRKLIFAAHFDVTMQSGWPQMEIIRNISTGSSHAVFATAEMEPKPTGYLNVYEYNITPNLDIQSGDILNISWYGDESDVRFLLAYYYDMLCNIPLVSIVVGECDPERYCKPVTEPSTNGSSAEHPTVGITSVSTVITKWMNSVTKSTDQSNVNTAGKSLATSKVIGGVAMPCFLLLVIISCIVILLYLRKKRKTSASETEDSTMINSYVK